MILFRYLYTGVGAVALLAATAVPAFAVQSNIKAATSQTLMIRVGEKEVAKGAENFVSSLAQRAIDFLSDEKLSTAARKEEFRKLLHDNFDMKTIGRFALGRYWRTSTKEQQVEYQKLFEEMIVNVYSSRFGDYQGQKFDVRSSRADNDQDTLVSSYIKGETGEEIEVQWRVRYKGKRYMVVDVIVEGVSMAMTQRSDFASVIQRGGGDVQVLLAHLRNG